MSYLRLASCSEHTRINLTVVFGKRFGFILTRSAQCFVPWIRCVVLLCKWAFLDVVICLITVEKCHFFANGMPAFRSLNDLNWLWSETLQLFCERPKRMMLLGFINGHSLAFSIQCHILSNCVKLCASFFYRDGFYLPLSTVPCIFITSLYHFTLQPFVSFSRIRIYVYSTNSVSTKGV